MAARFRAPISSAPTVPVTTTDGVVQYDDGSAVPMGGTPTGAPTRPSYRRRTGISTFANSKVGGASGGGTEVQLSPQTVRFPFAYIIADPGNGTSIAVGEQGAEVITMNPGDVFPFFDVAPSDFWATSTAANQKVVFVGHGDPGA
jgi:hypothetical protein